jgi:hypothetical protein
VPFRSEAQMKFMLAKHPDIAKRWLKKYGPYKGNVKKKSSSNPYTKSLMEKS